MQLLECLDLLPLDHLKRIVLACGLEPQTDRHALARAVVACLTDPAWLQGFLTHLLDEEWSALKVVFFHGGEHGMTIELCYQIVNMLSGRRRKSSTRAIAVLAERGLLFYRTHNYRQVCFIPSDLAAVMTDIVGREMASRVCLPPDTAIRSIERSRDLLEDIHRFLAYVYRSEVPLTHQGQIFKRHLRAMLDLLASTTEEEESLTNRYPEPMGFLMGYALDRHLLMREQGLLQASDTLLTWVEQSADAKRSDLFAYWQDRYFYQDLQTFLSVVRAVGDRWAATSQLGSELESLISPSQRGLFLTRLKHHLTMFLAPLGIFELGETEAEGKEVDLVCRLTAAGAAILGGYASDRPVPEGHTSFVLQPTFEIIATRPVSGSVLWRLELIGDLVGHTDRTLTYRLSRQSIFRSLKKGLDGDSILTFLQTHSALRMPQNVTFDLIAWTRSYGQVYLQSVMLLRCADTALAEQIKASRRTSRFIIGELTPTDLIVEEAEYQALLEALEADGLMPRSTVERPSRA